MCLLQELYQDFQRTTEQLVKDKLQEQRVGVLPVPMHRPPLCSVSQSNALEWGQGYHPTMLRRRPCSPSMQSPSWCSVFA